MKRKLIIILNIVFIGSSVYLLIDDYMRVGKFQWVDPGSVADHEELYLNPVSVINIVFCFLSIFYQVTIAPGSAHPLVLTFLRKFLFAPLFGLYGLFSFLSGLILIVTTLAGLGMIMFNDYTDVLLSLLMLIISAGYALMGFLMLNQVLPDKTTDHNLPGIH